MIDFIAEHSRQFVNTFFYLEIVAIPLIASLIISIGINNPEKIKLLIGAIYLISTAILTYLFSVNISFYEKIYITTGILIYLFYMYSVLKRSIFFLKKSQTFKVQRKNGVFISYCTRNAPYVRLIAEQLMAHGIYVWFDEYEITTEQRRRIIENTDEENIEDFKNIISKVLKDCSIAICFTSQEYEQSSYCKTEADCIENSPVNKIIEIHTVEYEYFSEYQSNCQIKQMILGKEIEPIWEQLAIEFEIPYRMLNLEKNNKNIVTMKWYEPVIYNMDFSGWQQTGGRKVVNNEAFDVRGGMFTYKLDDLNIEANVWVGLQSGVYRSQFKDEVIKNRIKFIQESSKMMEKFCKYLCKLGLARVVLGTHFIEINPHDELEYLGYAFFTLYDLSSKTWFRQYSIVLPNPLEELKDQMKISQDLKKIEPNLGSEIEFCIMFAIKGASFQQYCRVGYLMDRVVTSLRCPIPNM